MKEKPKAIIFKDSQNKIRGGINEKDTGIATRIMLTMKSTIPTHAFAEQLISLVGRINGSSSLVSHTEKHEGKSKFELGRLDLQGRTTDGGYNFQVQTSDKTIAAAIISEKSMNYIKNYPEHAIRVARMLFAALHSSKYSKTIYNVEICNMDQLIKKDRLTTTFDESKSKNKKPSTSNDTSNDTDPDFSDSLKNHNKNQEKLIKKTKKKSIKYSDTDSDFSDFSNSSKNYDHNYKHTKNTKKTKSLSSSAKSYSSDLGESYNSDYNEDQIFEPIKHSKTNDQKLINTQVGATLPETKHSKIHKTYTEDQYNEYQQRQQPEDTKEHLLHRILNKLDLTEKDIPEIMEFQRPTKKQIDKMLEEKNLAKRDKIYRKIEKYDKMEKAQIFINLMITEEDFKKNIPEINRLENMLDEPPTASYTKELEKKDIEKAKELLSSIKIQDINQEITEIEKPTESNILKIKESTKQKMLKEAKSFMTLTDAKSQKLLKTTKTKQL